MANQRGFVMTWLVVTTPLLLLISAMVLDMGRVIMADQRLQIALDAAAYAASNPGDGEVSVYPMPVPVGQAPTFRAELSQHAAAERARSAFDQSDLFQRPLTTPPTSVMGITVTNFSVTLVDGSTAVVTANITVPTHIVGAALTFFGRDNTHGFALLTISRQATARTVSL